MEAAVEAAVVGLAPAPAEPVVRNTEWAPLREWRGTQSRLGARALCPAQHLAHHLHSSRLRQETPPKGHPALGPAKLSAWLAPVRNPSWPVAPYHGHGLPYPIPRPQRTQ